MICTYYINVAQFEDDKLFEEKLQLLSPYRQQKVALLKNRKDKNRSLGAGIALDHALETYGLKERGMEYEIGEWGRPTLKYYPGIYFSLSHSGDYAICSIGEQQVGNDIEFIKEGRLKVADRFFCEEEKEWVYAAKNEQEIEKRMFRIWTIKESFLKVTGRGMSLPLQDFTVLMEEENRRIKIRQTVEAKYFHVREYDDIAGYRVALCCKETKDIAYSMISVTL